jgi:membrane-associated phospholipid phosphatase
MRKVPALLFGLSVFARSLPADAQTPSEENTAKVTSPVEPPKAEAPARALTEEERAKLVQSIMTSEADADDLAWLYSQADEYTPSRLTGKPIAAPILPERGEGAPRRWDPSWRKFGVMNYVFTGLSVAGSASASFIPEPKNPWTKTNELDEWGRRTISLASYESGQWAQDTSDLLLSLNMAFPLLVDSLIVSYWYRRSPEVAGQSALIAVEAMAFGSMLQGISSAAFARERPYGRDCGTKVDADLPECTTNVRYRSYFSGHTTLAFASAGVTCTNHAVHRLFGDPFADAVTCGATLATAGAVGTLRIVSQKHYVTDVLTGAAVGTATGLGIPWLLHYGPLASVNPKSDSGLAWTVVPLDNGLAIGGVF